METINYKNRIYPKIQNEGFAAQYAFPFATKFCKGKGFDIGCNRLEWSFPGSFPIDLAFDDEWSATNLPDIGKIDYIFSSHCLEHLPDWVSVLEYWTENLSSGGTMFLYLPDYSQDYWKPWNNRKHLHIFTPPIMTDYFNDNPNYTWVFCSGVDLLNSFMIVAEKK